MRSALVGFCTGVISVAWIPLGLKVQLGLGVLLCLLSLACLVNSRNVRVRNSVRLAGGLSFGVMYALGVGAYNLQHRLKDCGTGAQISVIVRVSSIPVAKDDRQSFNAEVLSISSLQPDSDSGPVDCASLSKIRNLRLSWYEGTRVSQNQVWRVLVKLRAPRGYLNQGGFDYEAWMFRSRFDASAVVKVGTLLKSQSRHSNRGLQGVRNRARSFFLQSPLLHSGVMLALVTGDGQAIPEEQWAIFRTTGTIHLVVISGLHIGLIAALGFMLGQVLVRLFPFILRRVRARSPGVLFGLVCGYVYCELSGWQVPAQRAFTMLAIVAFLYLLNRRLSSASSLLAVFTILMLLDPLSPLAVGFWLSFGAVVVLLFFFVPRTSLKSREASNSRIMSYIYRLGSVFAGLLKMQGVLFVGMLPLFWIWIGQISWVAPLANLLAVPVISWLVVPGAMSSFLLFEIGFDLSYPLRMLSNSVLESLFSFLEAIENLAVLQYLGLARAGFMNGAGFFGWLITALSAGLLLLPIALRKRFFLVAGLLIPFVSQSSGLEEGQFKLTVLDVGQGSAYLVETANKRLLYDTAAITRTGFDFGEAVVVPALSYRGIRQLDVVVLSHADIDHVGGFKAISGNLQIGKRYLGSPMSGIGGELCRAGHSWQWDGVVFEFIHPSLDIEKSTNDQSCVLLVKNARQSVLLAGDISKRVERRIQATLEPVSVLVVAHHGSDTSSSFEFLEKARPALSVISAGYSNRYRHPHPNVIARLKKHSQEIVVTANAGAVTWISTEPDKLVSTRSLGAPYWRVRAP